jgi:NAD(P) transhydrogenase subunit alpha
MTQLDPWSMVFVFMLATFIGIEVIRGVSRLLHTPLMSLTNAISAIAIVGSIIITGEQKDTMSLLLGAVAVAASMTNIVSGFLITDRMLKMFKEKKAAPSAVAPSAVAPGSPAAGGQGGAA